MKMRKMRTALAAMTIVALTFTACSGDDGETGPAGPAGNANVNSTNQSVMVDDWTPGAVLRDTIDAPEVTQDVVDNGAVMVYLKVDTVGSTTWEALTYTQAITGLSIQGDRIGVDMSIEFSYDVGMVMLNVKNTINQDLTQILQSYPPNDYMFKVVIIPSVSLVQGVDVNNYEEVRMVYGIEEYDLK